MRLDSPHTLSTRRAAVIAGRTTAATTRLSPDAVDLDSELSYWRAHYRVLFGRPGLRFSDYEPAVKLGLDAYVRAQIEDRPQAEDELRDRYRRVHGASRLDWNDARAVAEAACERLQRERGRR
ncbi:hypothetical protein J5226_17900 [Lysobacter sp. K5869]|uniref:hypothetical protein n=1 Tax=Lysobacter sp. K5869 TaxID=2820808 RepID=UPI001C05F0D9|nr:hypothetical protein [Lysobacter sp. K5869]QWP75476.1 hypothetical protein J5226_17900 [Lysobacter sp. K5869]